MLAKLTTKNQITLPRKVIQEFSGIEYFDAAVQDGRIVLAPVRMQPVDATLNGIREKMKKLGITPADVEDAVQWGRSKEP
ncbi:MAG: AbrB/MazE/SpoVT family DNA-binding domain-containing protein [Proteobacteria bacterium]|nr:AbrB/MazE/SpoVT family DNA-binding domain-containing protein [Pseudomonadota bacterium]MBU1966541.1 AbrB/MazE/SpoVT family DNA-binding domain-containing protein [Pseudomonadota bacterium]